MNWSNAEIAVFIIVGLMVLLKLWSVWHVASKAKANKEGRIIFLGLITMLTAFGVSAKFYISYQMGL